MSNEKHQHGKESGEERHQVRSETHRGGSVRALPAPCSMFIFHQRVDIVLWTCPFPP